MRNTALIVVDVQNDFCEGGKLAVEGGNEVARKIKEYATTFSMAYDRIVWTADCHNHWPDTNGGHFSQNPDYVDSWPVHCEKGTPGAAFHPEQVKLQEKVRYNEFADVFYKGQGKPDYSGFQGYNLNFLQLGNSLRRSGIDSVDICGIAGDYCVKETALDALSMGFFVEMLPDKIVSVGGTEATLSMVETIDATRLRLLQSDA